MEEKRRKGRMREGRSEKEGEKGWDKETERGDGRKRYAEEERNRKGGEREREEKEREGGRSRRG